MPACLTLCIAIAALFAGRAAALEHVVYRDQNREVSVSGRLVVKAEDGGLVVQSADGALWTIEPQDLVAHTSDDAAFVPLTAAQLSARLVDELPQGFEVHATQHYLICYNTSRGYAQWCGALFERLYRGFETYWPRRGLDLKTPEFPLVAIVFADRHSYEAYAQQELGAATQSIVGFYSLKTNRMTMYDLTGVESLRGRSVRRGSAAQINQLLSQPDAERTVATIVHEATHQIAFNCGLHTRFADIPLWVSEGVAVYFETPDLSSSKGWKTIGGVNPVRLTTFRSYLSRRPGNSLESLLADDKRIRDPQRALDAYAEAWALNYFLIRQKPTQYASYLRQLATKRPFVWDKPEDRLKEFRQTFGQDLSLLEAEFLRYMSKVQ